MLQYKCGHILMSSNLFAILRCFRMVMESPHEGEPLPSQQSRIYKSRHKRLSYHLTKVSALVTQDNIRNGGRYQLMI